jgi:hypothetical protein
MLETVHLVQFSMAKYQAVNAGFWETSDRGMCMPYRFDPEMELRDWGEATMKTADI